MLLLLLLLLVMVMLLLLLLKSFVQVFHCPVEIRVSAVVAATLETPWDSYDNLAVDAAIASGGVLAGSVQVVQRSEMRRRGLVMVVMMMMVLLVVTLLMMFTTICDYHGLVVNFGRRASAGQGGIVPEWGGRGCQ